MSSPSIDPGVIAVIGAILALIVFVIRPAMRARRRSWRAYPRQGRRHRWMQGQSGHDVSGSAQPTHRAQNGDWDGGKVDGNDSGSDGGSGSDGSGD